MAMLDRFSNPYGVCLSSPNEVCYYCAREYLAKAKDLQPEEKNVVTANRELAGKLENQKVWRFMNNTFCKEHLLKIAKECGATKEDFKDEEDV